MKIFVIAGEKSGDKQGALVMQEMLRREPSIQFEGLGGDQMHALSPDIENWAEEAAVIGFIDVLKKFSFFKRHLTQMAERIIAAQPDCVLLIDYPGFNQRLAERIKKKSPHTKIAYFIAPMVWAWHKGRLPKLARVLDLMLCTFPFEKAIFEGAGLKTEFVGHPLVDDIRERRQVGIRQKNLIGLFPGSRKKEIDKIFPVYLEFIKAAQIAHPEWTYKTSASSEKLAARMRACLQKAGVSEQLVNICPGSYHDLMDEAEVALVASGTATTEAALHELPFALVYKAAALTAWVARKVLTIKYLGMVNLLVDKPVVKELLQQDFTPAACIAELERLLKPEESAKSLHELKESIACLGNGGAAQKAATAVLELLHAQQS